jgi:peptide/nickel transport system substrate-binding protein
LNKALPRLFSVVVLLSGIALACACSGEATAPPRAPSTLHVGVALPPTDVSTLGFAAIANNLVFEPLVGIGWDGRPVAKLASSWTWSDDRLSVRFDFDPKIKFHDGTQLTAPIAAEILKKHITPRGGGITFASVKSIAAQGERSVEIRLTRPEAFFLADLANVTLSAPSNVNVGTGPFKFMNVEQGSKGQDTQIQLASFLEYHRGRPQVTSVELKRYDDQRGAWAALMRGEIDAVHEVSPSAMDFVENQSTVSTFPHTRPYFIQLLFNLRHPALKKAAVRQALSHAVDRQTMVKTALHGRGIIADSPVWPQHWAYVVPPKTYALNTEAATLLLDAAGLSVKPSNEPGRMKSRFRFVCLTLENDARYEKIGILLQKQLYDIGVDMDVVALPYKELAGRIAKSDFDALLLERSSGRSLAWAYYNYHSSLVPSGYRAADEVLNRLRRAASDNESRLALNEFLQILYDDPPAVFLAWPVVSRAVSNKFAVPAETGRDVMGSLWQWQPVSKPAP